MNIFTELKTKINQLIDKGSVLARDLGYKEFHEELDEIRQQMETDYITVVVAGEFKQGKSSLLNAYIEEAGFFPVDLDITTNLITTIRYGEVEKITVWIGEPGEEKPHHITRDEVWDYVTEQRNPAGKRKHNARLLEIESPIPKLKDGFVLVDTPGVGGLNAEHTEITYNYIPNADIVLFVSDVFEVMTTAELEFVKRIQQNTDRILFVATKIDARAEFEQVLESNRTKLAETLGIPPDQILILPVSSKLKLDYLEEGEMEDLEDSNYTKFEQSVWDIVNTSRPRVLLGTRISQVADIFSNIHEDYKSKHVEFPPLGKEELEKIQQQINQKIKSFDEFSKSGAQWRRDLEEGVVVINDKIVGQFNNDMKRIRYNVDDYIEDDERMKNLTGIADFIAGEVAASVTRVDKQMRNDVAQLHKGITNKYKELELNPFKLKSFEWDEKKPDFDGFAAKEATGIFAKAVEVVQRGFITGTAGAVVGGVIGAAAGGILTFFAGGVGAIPGAITGAAIFGGAIGKIGGMISGGKRKLKSIKKQDASVTQKQVKKILNPYFDEIQSESSNNLKKSLRKLKISVSDSIDKEIKRKKKIHKQELAKLQDRLNELNKSREEAKKAARAEARKHAEVMKKIKTLHDEATAIYSSIVG